MPDWYRYVVHFEGSWDYARDVLSWRRPVVYLQSYQVLKTTPKGVWLDMLGGQKFVLRDARKRFACPTVEEAAESFVARKRRQIKICKSRLLDAEDELRAFQEAKPGEIRTL